MHKTVPPPIPDTVPGATGGVGVQDYRHGEYIELQDATGWPTEPVKAAAVAMAKRCGDTVNHPYYADLFMAGFAAFMDTLSDGKDSQ